MKEAFCEYRLVVVAEEIVAKLVIVFAKFPKRMVVEAMVPVAITKFPVEFIFVLKIFCPKKLVVVAEVKVAKLPNKLSILATPVLVILLEKKLVVVAFPPVALVKSKFVIVEVIELRTAEKILVAVAFEIEALAANKFVEVELPLVELTEVRLLLEIVFAKI